MSGMATGVVRSRPGGWLPMFTACCLVLVALAAPLRAQELALDGWVVDGNGTGIPGAVVELGNTGATLTDDEGGFRFEGVAAGTYRLRVRAFGFEDYGETVDVRTNRTVTIGLEETAFELDSLVVGAEKVEVRGRVRDPARDENVPAVEIRTSQDDAVLTDAGGRFEVDAWENVPLRLVALAFGYFAADTLVVPTADGEPIVLELTEDPVVQAMLGAANRRIENRGRGRRSITTPALERDDIARWGGAALDEVLRLEYPVRSRRLVCLVADEWPMSPLQAEGFLTTTPAWEVERMEFLFDGQMLRVYTRDFMKTMLSGGVQLGAPALTPGGVQGPFCT